MTAFNREFLEENDIIPAFNPVDMQTGANNGLWIDMSKLHRLVCVLFKGSGTGGDDPVFTLAQAKDNASGSSKALATITRARTKIGASTIPALWTLATQAAGSTYTPTSAANPGIIVIEVLPTDLDINGGFTHVRMSIPDVGSNAQIGCGFYVAYGMKYVGATTITNLG